MKKIKILLFSMLIITAIYVSVVVYANSSGSSGGGVDAAWLYQGEPEEWYTPEQLGIVEILGYEENATWIHIVYRDQGPLINPEEQPIFKYKGKFWQISELHVFPALPESAKRWQVPVGGAIGGGWIFLGVLLFKGRKRELKGEY